MTVPRMHADEVETSVVLVRRLLAAQFPRWADLPITPVRSAGTDNAIYRLGIELVVRLPRIGWAVAQVEKEHLWLPRLAPLLPLAVPVPLAQGTPGEGYPSPWAVHRWLEGESAVEAHIPDLCQAARDLAEFVRALQQVATTGAPPATEHNLRGVSLGTREASVRAAIASLHGLIDTDTATAAWEVALAVPEWDRPPVWFHGDLLPGNVLVQRGRPSAVIDFGGLGVGDPACDLMIAWSLFSGESRDVFRASLGVDDATWARGRGHALAQALVFVPYYLKTNPVGVRAARRAIEEVLADHRRGG
ncbi:aminoglycoside phosphotransferase family protein [Deinococcus sp. YIM 134068]|uniref:aminoglycoside phosphotransferase family protein n=1 Tax=Deinococcus lichenicola TaxID=3118910 RepID=UPI002F9504B0